MSRVLKYLLLMLAIGSFQAGIARADDQQARHRVSFQVDAEREVANDLMVVVMKVLAEDSKTKRVAEEVNRSMQWALEQAKSAPEIKVQSGNYRTWPVYDDKKIVRWRGQQELWLESGDVEQLSQLTGVLQDKLQVESMQFQVSSERREAVMNELISEALAAFRQRAGIVRTSLGADGYQLDDVSINSRGRPPVVPVRMRAAAMGASDEANQPAVERGTSRVTVQVSGSVKLTFKGQVED